MINNGYIKFGKRKRQNYILDSEIACDKETYIGWSRVSEKFIKNRAREMGISIPEPLSVNDLFGDSSRGKVKPTLILVDEMPTAFQTVLGITIDTATMTERDNY